MMKKIMIFTLLFVSILNAATIDVNKNVFKTNEQIIVSFADMSAQNDDWIAIYKENSSNSWGNVIKWKWTNDIAAGNLTFDALPAGNYEVRSFYNNSYQLEASKKFRVQVNVEATTVTTNKNTYTLGEGITATFANMSGNAQDWIAIYPAGSTTAWANMIQWKWVDGNIQGTRVFEPLPVGDYEVRVFFNNSAHLEGSHAFSVENNTGLNLESRKAAYDPFELIFADFTNMRGAASDWIGIFPVGADNQKASAIQWKYAKSLVNGELNFNGLAVGTYEMRAYFSTLHKKTIVFDVQDTAVTKIEYEDAEGGFDQVWSVWQNPTKPVTIINAGAAGSAHSIRAIKYVASYFSFSNPDKKLRFLEFDTRVGIASHVGNFGVSIKTKLGNRRIVFSSYMNHPGNVFHNDPARFAAPRTSNNGRTHNHPGPTDYYLETRNGNFIHYKINIEEKLRMLEPDNELLGMRYFTSAGGDFDNIQLVSH